MMCLITCGGWLLVGTILFGIWWYFDQKHGTPHMNIEPSHKIIGRVNEIYQQIQPNPSKYEPKTHQPIPRTHPASSIYSTSMPPNPIIRDHMITNQNDYDVVIMGGGAAGLLQTLHLQLYCPGIKIAIIDPLPANRTGMACDGAWDQLDATHKIGESTVFPSAAFLVRDLNLGDYLIENHPPKYGLFYLWPKQVEQTATWSDYFTMVSNRMPELPSFQLDRVKLERDLLVKILSDTTTPVTYFQGTVKQVTLTDDEKSGSTETPMIMGEAAHTVDILLNDGKTESETSTSTSTSTSTALSLHGSHVIDCAGRAFVIGRKKKLMTNNSSELMDIDNSSVWIHVTDYDMNLFIGDVSRGQTLSTWYYATNHFCGDGYWLWVIPIETRHGRAISIGVSFHKQVHTLNQFNTQDKFLRFLEANQNILYRIAMSGTIRLFKKLPRLAHVSSQFYSPNNWYVLGEAAYNVDPWYSTGLTWCSFQIQQTTAIVSSKLHITRAMYASQQLKQTVHVSTLNTLLNETNHLTTLYDTFAGNLVKTFLLNITRHWKHLGNASIMSWRLLMETASPQTVIGYLSKVYLCPIGCMKSTQYTDDRIWLLSGIYDILDECIDKKINIGLQDYNEPHRVPLMESTMLDLLEVDSSLRGGKYTFHSSNIPKVEAWGVLYMLLGVILLVWRALGVQGYLRPAVYQRLGYLFKSMILAYYRSWQWWFRNRHLITNQRFHKREQEFEKYQVGQTYVPW